MTGFACAPNDFEDTPAGSRIGAEINGEKDGADEGVATRGTPSSGAGGGAEAASGEVESGRDPRPVSAAPSPAVLDTSAWFAPDPQLRMREQLDEETLTEIERLAFSYETSGDLRQIAGYDVPALVAELRTFRARCSSLERENTRLREAHRRMSELGSAISAEAAKHP